MSLLFHNIIIWLESSKYILLFTGTVLEGPIVMMTSGFLYRLGSFSFFPMYLALVFGDFVADILWYCLGRYGTRNAIYKYGHFVGVTPETIEKVEHKFLKFHQKILIISKLTMGLGFAAVVLVVAGMFKVPFRNYVILNLIGGFIWTALLVTIGFFLGNIFLIIPGTLKIAFVLVIFIAFIFGLRYANKYLKNKNI